MEREPSGKNQSNGASKKKNAGLYGRFEQKMLDLLDGEELSALVALSGGADSTALLVLSKRFANEHGGVLEALHVHHGIRGEEADRDAKASKELCEKLGVPFHFVKVDVPALAAAQKRGLEEAARAARYAALNRVRAERGLRCLATGHNAEDQLETMIFQLCRGCSLKGLAGIPEKRGVILRPLLSFSKKELEDYCTENGVSFVYDSSNDDERFSRNKTRRQVIPALLEICPGALDAAGRLSRSLAEDEALLEDLTPAELPPLDALASLPPPLLRRALVAAFDRCAAGAASLESVHLEALCRLVRDGKTGDALSLPGKISARRGKTLLNFKKKVETEKSGGFFGEGIALRPGKNLVPEANLTVYLFDRRTFDEFWAKNQKIHSLFKKVELNSAKISNDLLLRSRAAADKIAFGGMTRQVSKLAAAIEGDPEKRKHYPVICDGEGVLWVPGYRPRDGAEGAGDRNSVYILIGRTDEMSFRDIKKDIDHILVTGEELDRTVSRLAAEIDRDQLDRKNDLLLLGILKGSTVFMGDLMKKIRTPLEIDFMKVSSYGAGTSTSGDLRITLDFKREHLENLDIVIVEDIIDSGNTLSRLVRLLQSRGASSVRTCTLLDKPERRQVDFTPDYVGLVVPDEFVVGYGLDYNEKYRELPFVGVLKKEIYE